MRCELALHAANGLAYLHELRIVHFDLKPDNLLLDGPSALVAAAATAIEDVSSATRTTSAPAGSVGTPQAAVPTICRLGSPGALDAVAEAIAGGWVPTVKVADFGLSKHKVNNFVSSCRDLRGTLPYMAPELVADPERVSEKADVWSIGVVMWEMLTREMPYQVTHILAAPSPGLLLREGSFVCLFAWRSAEVPVLCNQKSMARMIWVMETCLLLLLLVRASQIVRCDDSQRVYVMSLCCRTCPLSKF